ncbi:MAG TPA: lipid A deacylase LpxR family protein [Terriglobia bacterium]|nr:lipid A deacylase LpxR family protein [Terriglobia bacterium]
MVVCAISFWHRLAWGESLSANQPDLLVTNTTAGARGSISLRLENDAFAGTDEDYSNGISVSLLLRGRGLLGGFWDLFGKRDREYFQGYEAGQVIITPADTSLSIPDPNDRPYAGMLYVDIATAMRQANQFHGFKIVTGVVGPYSLAEETQNWFHGLIGSGRAQGWDYQLHNEPILNLVYEHRRKYQLFHAEPGFSADVIPGINGMLGNVLIQAQAGAQVRLGYNLPDDFGTTLLRGFGSMPFPQHQWDKPAPNIGVYVFGSIGGTAVARNLSLDGNTFQDSPHVEKRPFFPAMEVGASLCTRWFQATFSYVYWGKEFYGQQQDSKFGAVSLGWFF